MKIKNSILRIILPTVVCTQLPQAMENNQSTSDDFVNSIQALTQLSLVPEKFTSELNGYTIPPIFT